MQSVFTSTTPWYRSTKAIILTAILLPPVGLMLVWARSDAETGKKVFGSLVIVALGVVYSFILFGGGLFLANPDPRSEAHYAALERQRAQQRETAIGASVAPRGADQNAVNAAGTTSANAN